MSHSGNAHLVMVNAVGNCFVCPGCAQEIEVDAAMREAIIDAGCAVCGSAVTAEAFS